jgi:1-deoxy-D-xylulose-5-phosphate reductoisomerase
MMKNLTILGSTGSIGTSTLDIVRRNPEHYKVFALVAGQNLDALVPQIIEFQPEIVVVATNQVLEDLISRLSDSGWARSNWPALGAGAQARIAASTASKVDFVMSAIVGVMGLEATHKAVQCGKTIGLANKEVLAVAAKLPVSSLLPPEDRFGTRL